MNLKTQQLFTAGIIDHFADYDKRIFDQKFYKRLSDLTPKYMEVQHVTMFSEGPEVLTLNHLEGGFVVWLISMSFAIFAFIFEWLIKVKEFLIIKYLLLAFYKQKRMESN